jgi:hypothetical protein
MDALSRLRKSIIYPVFGALLLALVVWGQPQPALAGTGPGVSPAAGEIGGYADLVAALQAAGVTVTPGGDVDQPLIPVKGHLITINGADVQVFEFQDDATRQQVSDTILQAQNSVDTSLPSGVTLPNVWAKGRLIVVYVGDDQATITTLSKILGNTITQTPAAAVPPQVTLAAQNRLAAALGVPANQVQLVSAAQVQWPNTCLGLTPPGAACADMVTPGWRLIFNVNGQQYEVRTNETASLVRWQPQAGPDTSLSGLKSQAIKAEKQLEKDVQQAGLKGELTKLEKQVGVSGPEITQAWEEFQSQANTVLEQLNRDISQLSKNIQTSGASNK